MPSSIEKSIYTHPGAPVCGTAVHCYRLAHGRRLRDTTVATNRTNNTQNVTVNVTIGVFAQYVVSSLLPYQRLRLPVDWRDLEPVDFFHHFGKALRIQQSG